MSSAIVLTQRRCVSVLDKKGQADEDACRERADDQEVAQASPPGAHSGHEYNKWKEKENIILNDF